MNAITRSVGLVLLLGMALCAAPLDYYDTGVNVNGSVDQSWTISFLQGGSWGAAQPAFVVANNGYGFTGSTSSSWVVNPAGAKWIAPYEDYTGRDEDAPGYYLFSQVFTPAQTGTFQFGGIWSADDLGVAIFLNQVDMNVTPIPEPGYSSLHPFSFTGTLTPGQNRIDILVQNTECNCSLNPTGLLFEVTNATAVPEPGAVGLIGGGLILLGLLRRRL
jgi:hypothetical protein